MSAWISEHDRRVIGIPVPIQPLNSSHHNRICLCEATEGGSFMYEYDPVKVHSVGRVLKE